MFLILFYIIKKFCYKLIYYIIQLYMNDIFLFALNGGGWALKPILEKSHIGSQLSFNYGEWIKDKDKI